MEMEKDNRKNIKVKPEVKAELEKAKAKLEKANESDTIEELLRIHGRYDARLREFGVKHGMESTTEIMAFLLIVQEWAAEKMSASQYIDAKRRAADQEKQLELF